MSSARVTQSVSSSMCLVAMRGFVTASKKGLGFAALVGDGMKMVRGDGGSAEMPFLQGLKV